MSSPALATRVLTAYRRGWLIALAVGALAGVLMGLHRHWTLTSLGQPAELAPTLLLWLQCYLLWVIFAPAAWAWADWTETGADRHARLLRHTCGAALFATAYATVAGASAWVRGHLPAGLVGDVLLYEVLPSLLIYAAIALVHWLLSRLREREHWRRAAAEAALRQAQLDAELRTAQLDALTARLNPHFLFNTLNALSVLVVAAPAQAQQLIRDLSSLLRATLRTGRDTLPWHEEEALVRHYLQIESLRYGPQLQIAWQLSPDVGPLAIPAFALQTLVENAVNHGAAKALGGGQVQIHAQRRGDRLVVTVRNTGPAWQEAAGSAGNRVALANLAERLQALYGDAAHLDHQRTADGWTEVRLALPAASAPPAATAPPPLHESADAPASPAR